MTWNMTKCIKTPKQTQKTVLAEAHAAGPGMRPQSAQNNNLNLINPRIRAEIGPKSLLFLRTRSPDLPPDSRGGGGTRTNSKASVFLTAGLSAPIKLILKRPGSEVGTYSMLRNGASGPEIGPEGRFPARKHYCVT